MIKGTTSNNVEVVVGQRTPVVNLDKTSMAPAVIESTREQFSLTTIGEKFKQEIIASGEIDKLTSLINLNNTTSIIEFGRKPAEEISRVADSVLANYDMTTLNQVSGLVNNLLNLMKKVDMKEIEEVSALVAKQAKKSFLDKFFESAEKKLTRIIGKYQSVSVDIEKICQELSVYENQIKTSNRDIDRLYHGAIEHYKQLVKYIAAGEQAIVEIEDYRDSLQERINNGDGSVQFELQNVNQALNLMDQRVADLKASEAVALQSIPTYKIQEYSNANLARKVNSAFIITIPAFKSALAQSVISKQQAIQAQGLQALDAATNELIMQNARNAVNQLQQSQKLANSTAVSADTIEKSWEVLMNGITQYKEMEDQYKQIRNEEKARIEAANNRYTEAISRGVAI